MSGDKISAEDASSLFEVMKAIEETFPDHARDITVFLENHAPHQTLVMALRDGRFPSASESVSEVLEHWRENRHTTVTYGEAYRQMDLAIRGKAPC